MSNIVGLTAEQVNIRSQGIGASEVAAVVGFNKWQGPHDLWMRKLGLIEDTEYSIPARIGLYTEDGIARLYSEESGYKLENPRETFAHPDYEWALASPDRFALNDVGERLFPVEIKNIGGFSSRDWDKTPEGVPAVYFLQVQWQMFVLGYDYAELVPVLSGNDFRRYPIEYNESVVEELRLAVQRFWFDNVQARVAPAVDGSKSATRMLDRIYRDTPLPELLAPEAEHLEHAEALAVIKAKIDALEDEKRLHENALKDAIGARAGINGVAKWTHTKGRVKTSACYKSLPDRLRETIESDSNLKINLDKIMDAVYSVQVELEQANRGDGYRRFTLSKRK